MFRKVLLEGSSILRTKCRLVTAEELEKGLQRQVGNTAEAMEVNLFLMDMYHTMVAESGMGLAANQIGWPLQIFILKNKTSTGFDEYINPIVLSEEELVDFDDEGCLSIPGVSAKTKRFRKVKLQWQNRYGTLLEGIFENMDAFAVQHEMDHLNGKLYIDQLGPVKKSLVMKKHKKYVRALRKSNG